MNTAVGLTLVTTSADVGAATAVPLPLVVDLDHTLVRTDTLVEALATIVFRCPRRLPGVLLALADGRAALKAAAAAAADLDCASLPYDPAVMELITRRRMQHSEVHLVTAANQRIADDVAMATGVFDSATGSSASENLKGEAKASRVAASFPGGFDYVGDCDADLPIWHRASTAIVAGGSPSLLTRLARAGLDVEVLPRPAATLRVWIKALRLHQWSKNLLLLVPLLLGQNYRDPVQVLYALAGVLIFGVIASSTYLINDLVDLRSDRLHPTKRFRPLAAGVIPITTAAPVAAVLLAGGVAASWLVSPAFGSIATGYVILTLCYSFRLKREPLVDVTAIAGLFGLRIAAGMIVISHPLSLWLTSFTITLFLSLALAKRTAELVRAARLRIPVPGRGYVPGDEGLTTAFGIAFGTVSIVVMILYLSLDAMPAQLYHSHGPLFLIPVVLALWIMRIWLMAHRGTLDDDPVIYALRDRTSLIYGAITIALWAGAVA